MNYNGDGNIGALIIRIGFWGPLDCHYNQEPPQNSIGIYLGPYIICRWCRSYGSGMPRMES